MFGINTPHWHLLFNHLPVVGGMFSTLLLIYALVRRNAELKRASLIAWIIVAIMAFASAQTGGPAARSIRGLAGVNGAMIREHSEAADFAAALSYAAGALSLLGLVLAFRRKDVVIDKTNGHAYEAYRRYKEPPSWAMIVVLVVGLVQVAAMMRTANLGGEVRHPEINNDSLSHMIRAAPLPPAQNAPKDDDD